MEMSVFDHFPEPVFYLQSGQIRYSNSAALALEPGWKPGKPVPAALALEPDENGVFSCVLGRREFAASATRTRNGLLLVLRELTRAPVGQAPRYLSAQMREQLNTIQAGVQILASELEESGSAKARGSLSKIQLGFYRLLRMARHLELARRMGEEIDLAVDIQFLDLAELCRKEAYAVARLAEQAGIVFREDVPAGIVPSAGDRDLLEVMLLELISNALKAAGTGGEAGLRMSTDGRRAVITVWDNGPGTSQDVLTALMDGSPPGSLPKPGAGLRLGLPIARYAAAVHGGTILLESQEGEGLRATVSLPLRRSGRDLTLHTPKLKPEEGFSTLMTFLSDALPSGVYAEEMGAKRPRW